MERDQMEILQDRTMLTEKMEEGKDINGQL